MKNIAYNGFEMQYGINHTDIAEVYQINWNYICKIGFYKLTQLDININRSDIIAVWRKSKVQRIPERTTHPSVVLQ